MENFVNEILGMVQKILAYFNEIDGANVVAIIKDAFAGIFG